MTTDRTTSSHWATNGGEHENGDGVTTTRYTTSTTTAANGAHAGNGVSTGYTTTTTTTSYGDGEYDDGGLSSAKIFERIRIKALSGTLAYLNFERRIKLQNPSDLFRTSK